MQRFECGALEFIGRPGSQDSIDQLGSGDPHRIFVQSKEVIFRVVLQKRLEPGRENGLSNLPGNG